MSKVEIEVLRKLSVGIINGVRKGFKGIKAPTYLARVAGIVRAGKPEEGDAGAYVKFIGEFRMWNREGKEYGGPVALLPEPAQAALVAALANDTGSGIEFALNLIAVPNEAGTHYTWQVGWLVEPRKSDPLAELLAGLGEAPAIAADTPPAPGDAPTPGDTPPAADAPADTPAPAAGKGKGKGKAAADAATA